MRALIRGEKWDWGAIEQGDDVEQDFVEIFYRQAIRGNRRVFVNERAVNGADLWPKNFIKILPLLRRRTRIWATIYICIDVA